MGNTTDIVTKETYDFKDRGDRDMTLRPEGTAGIVRSYIENKMYGDATQPIKLYYNGTMYRYERPQSGRDRELTQFGAEVLGSDDPIIDAEVISIPVNLFKILGLKEIKVNINTLGDDESRRAQHAGHGAPYVYESRQERKRKSERKTDCCGQTERFRAFFVEQFAVFDVFVGDEFVYRDAEEGRELFQTVYAGETAVVFPFGHRRTRDVKFVGKFLLCDVVLSPEFFEFFAECHIRLLRDNHTSAAPECHDTFRHVAQKYAKALLYSARKKVKITV